METDRIDPLDLLRRHGIDRARLAAVLSRAGQGHDAELVDLTATVIGTGQVGENLRCRLTWEGPGASGSPASVVVKIPSRDPTSLAAAAATRTYIREVGFYRDLRDRVAIRTPRPFHLDEDQAANWFVLVMEDITPSEPGDQLAGCDPGRAALAVDAAAALHGSSWGREELLDVPWLEGPSPESLRLRAELYAAVLPGFLERYRHALSADELEYGRWLGDADESLRALQRLPPCLTHGDFRLDNLLFGTGPGAPPVTTVDWQTVTFGQGPTDVAYFVSTGLTPADRRAHERGLLERYRAGLAAHGVHLSPTEVAGAYRAGAASGYAMAVIASQIVERTERGDAMFVAMARGSASLMTDLDVRADLS